MFGLSVNGNELNSSSNECVTDFCSSDTNECKNIRRCLCWMISSSRMSNLVFADAMCAPTLNRTRLERLL